MAQVILLTSYGRVILLALYFLLHIILYYCEYIAYVLLALR
jgi:hypothetical protein